MEESWDTYLRQLGLTKALVQKVQDAHNFYLQIAPEPIEDVFITNVIDSEHKNIYENLLFVSQKYIYEAKNFATSDDFDMAIIHQNIRYWKLDKENYDFANANESSRAHLYFTTSHGLSIYFKASQTNCDKIRHILLTYILPNMESRA